MVRGWNKQRSYDYEHTRAICYLIYAANRDQKKPLSGISQFWPLDTDEKTEHDPHAAQKELEAYRKELKEKYGAFLNKKAEA